MCLAKKMPTVTKTQIAAPDNAEAFTAMSAEARLRRRRAGAAADILTSPTGIPLTPTLGGTR